MEKDMSNFGPPLPPPNPNPDRHPYKTMTLVSK